MNKNTLLLDNRNFHNRIHIYILYLLSILMTPFIEMKLLFLLSIILFFGIWFSKKRASCCRNIISLYFSLSLMLFISFIFGNSSYAYPLYIVFAAFAIAAVGSQNYSPETDFISNSESRKRKIKNNNISIIKISIYLAIRIVAALFSAVWIIYWQRLPISYNFVFLIAVLGAITGSLFESISSSIDKNISVPLGAGMTMWVFEEFRYWVPAEKTIIALFLSFFLGLLAYRAKIADVSALLSAAILGVLIIVFSGISWFLLLLIFFILGGWFTRFKYTYKESIGIAQAKNGIRSYENVFSNSIAALVLAIAYGVFSKHDLPIVYAYIGTVATATGDTLASEIGTTAKGKPRMITTLKLSEPGIDGAVSLLGELASIFGSAVVGLFAYIFGVSDNLLLSVFIAILGGFFGTNIDSFFGATLQKKGLLSNSGVNFLAIFAGAGFSIILYFLINTN